VCPWKIRCSTARTLSAPRVGADVVEARRVAAVGDDHAGEALRGDLLGDLEGRERPQDHAADALAPEEPGERLVGLLVPAQVDDGDVEALLVDALEDAGEHRALEVAEAGAHGVGGVDQTDDVARRLAHRGDVAHPVGDVDDRCLVSRFTSGWSLSARDTVATDTPTSFAIIRTDAIASLDSPATPTRYRSATGLVLKQLHHTGVAV
jgi:hypothetical protein